MGCELSTLLQGNMNKQTDENTLARCPVASNQASVMDPRIPLNARQKYSMIASWKAINRAMEPTGVYMFIKLFEENDDLIELFEKFRNPIADGDGTPISSLESSLELAEHATAVMATLDEGIKALDSADVFEDFLKQIGHTHRRIPGFKKDYFWRIEPPFLEAAKMTLGDRYTENIENIYKVTIKLVIETLVKGYEMEEFGNIQGKKMSS